MSPLVAFNLARSSTTNAGTIVFDYIAEDTHGGYDTLTGQYAVRVDGIYVITLLTSSYLDRTHDVRLCTTSSCITIVYMQDTAHTDADTISKTILVDLNTNDRLYVSLNGVVYSDEKLHTSLIGFLYSPASSSSLAWSVATIFSMQGLVEPVPFDVTLVNTGAGWDIVRYR